jgi:very-short-patch-repair endonuclease
LAKFLPAILRRSDISPGNDYFAGWKFRRQYPVGLYIVDFTCVEKNLVIEVDGGKHAENKELDVQRSEYLNKLAIGSFTFGIIRS